MKKTLAPALSARDRILHKAHELFYRDGIRATGIDRIIDEAGVTKVTFYRHFPSKNDLIKAYLEYRHQLWTAWFVDALRRHQNAQNPLNAIVAALREWFQIGDYRGCAFINSMVELDGALPEVTAIALRHKHEMANAIGALLPNGKQREAKARAVAMAVDGAIVLAQMEKSPKAALKTLGEILLVL